MLLQGFQDAIHHTILHNGLDESGDWHCNGLYSGTASPVLFVLAMQVLLKAVEPSTEDAQLGKGVHMPPLKAFMDDTTILANRKAKAQSILDRFKQIMSWSRMIVKPSKSCSLSLRKGKIDDKVMFSNWRTNNPNSI